MKKRLFAALAAVSALVAAPAGAVTFGSPDGTAHPYVGNLLFKTPSGYFSCSGTLMSPTVVMTAGHCTEEAGVANLKTWVSFSPTINPITGCFVLPPVDQPACLDAYFDDPANGWIKGTAHPHPQYDDFAQFPATFDVGVVELETPVSMGTYGQLPPLGFLETIKKARDDRFKVVGYGLQGVIPAFASDIWARFVGNVRLVELNSAFNGGMSAKFSNNPGVGGGSCFGDSGGPILYGDTNVVVAV